MFLRLIYLKNWTFPSVKTTVDTLIDVRKETSKHHFESLLKINKIKYVKPCFPTRMFLSVSGHSSELSRANHSPRSTASKLKCVSDNISSWFENHQPQKTKIASVIYAPFIQNSNQMAARLTATTSFPRIFFQLLQYWTKHPSFSAGRAALMTKPDLTFPAFSLRFVDFAAQFCFRCKFSFHEERHSSQVWQWRDFTGPITILCSAKQPMKLLRFV